MPQYTDHNLRPVNNINYGWTGWASEGNFPPMPNAEFFSELKAAWEKDGLTPLTKKWKQDHIQFTFSARPDISPVLFTQRVKGRLQHALRTAGERTVFSRKVTMRSLGDNRSPIVEGYVHNQLKHEELADPRYKDTLKECAVSDGGVDFSEPSTTNSGQYWYNLHAVLVTADRFRIGEKSFLGKLRDTCLETASNDGHRIAALSVMPDHLHIALRGNVEMSPIDVGLAFQNSTAQVAGCRLWQEEFYVGTFSEYDLNAVRGKGN